MDQSSIRRPERTGSSTVTAEGQEDRAYWDDKYAEDECVDGYGEVWPEHDFGEVECFRCGAEPYDDVIEANSEAYRYGRGEAVNCD